MTIQEYKIIHKLNYGEIAEQLGVSLSKLSQVIHYRQRPNKLMLEGFERMGIEFPMKDVDEMNRVKTEKIKQLLIENDRLRRENSRLRLIIHNKLDVAIERMCYDIHTKSKLRKYRTKYDKIQPDK